MDDDLSYSWGFGNEHASEAVLGALPIGRNSPQRAPLGLYAEQLSATSFTTPRHENRRTWMYRVRPSAVHPVRRPIPAGRIRTAPFDEAPLEPNRIRWDPLPYPEAPTDFVDGLVTYGASGEASALNGIGIHMYAATASMTRAFSNFDGELLVVPQDGALLLSTELGRLRVVPGEAAVVPRGVAVCVELPDGRARGYVCENYGRLFALPELGPIGANGLANPRDFRSPVAWFDEAALDEPTTMVTKFGGGLWSCELSHTPFDVVAWHGSNVPYAYDLARFNAMNSVTYDHPDPSIFTVLTSPGEVPGTANADFVTFPPRWNVAEDTFRPPWFHRNVMSEFVGLVHGIYDAKAEGFLPGGASLHNCMSAHGPDAAAYDRASTVELVPNKIDNTLVIMFETRLPIRLTAHAATGPHRQADYDAVWTGLLRRF